MRKGNVLTIIIMLVCLIFLLGCSSSEGKKDSKCVDEEFIECFQNVLQKRWDLVENDNKKSEKSDIIELKETYKSYIDVELDGLEQYKDKTFEDSKLQEKAIQYINTLKDMKNSLDYITSDLAKYTNLYNNGDDERSKLISCFVNDYGLKVDEKYQSILDDFINRANRVNEKEDEKTQIDKLGDSIQFNNVEDSYGFKKYEAIIENNFGIDFKNFSMSINLLDKDGVIVDTTYSSVDNWQKGQKAKFDFSTNKDFTATKVTINYLKK